MNAIGYVARAVFLIGWAGGLWSWFIAARHLWRFNSHWWSVRASNPDLIKALKACALFILFGAMGISAALIGGKWGGWGTHAR